MIHPLLRLVATKPQLLADHAEAYAGLVGAEIGRTAAGLKQRALLGVVALCLVGVAAVLGGVALMLWAALPAASMRAPWALAAAPALPALVAVVCAFIAQRPAGESFLELKQQVAADLVLLRDVSAA